ncbi:MAG TPA: O-antigen polymerase [Actinomycetota bacterium]|nr:O-antigen polymerase [Actinomycetota bacterium]
MLDANTFRLAWGRSLDDSSKRSLTLVLNLLAVAPLVVVGLLLVGFHQESLRPWFTVLAYAAIGLTLFLQVNVSKDWLNPLILILGASVVRYTLPALYSRPEEVESIGVYRFLALTPGSWEAGHDLALLGILSTILGWVVLEGSYGESKVVKPQSRSALPLKAGMAVGLLSLVIFVELNGSFLTAVYTGYFRSLTVDRGGAFFYLGLILIPSAVILVSVDGVTLRLLRIAPSVLAASWYFILGGRARAATPLLAAVLTLRCLGANSAKRSIMKGVALAVTIGFISLLIAFSGSVYRATDRGDGWSYSIRSFQDYLSTSLIADIGNLHSLAAATTRPPGDLQGATFIGNLLWPLSKALGLPSQSAGVFLVRDLNESDRPSGLHASLIGDAYINFGARGVAIVCFLFGAAVKVIYLLWRKRLIHPAIYALSLVYALRIFLETIEKWPETLVVLGFGTGLLYIGRELWKPDDEFTRALSLDSSATTPI